jgi:hypothetical protein
MQATERDRPTAAETPRLGLAIIEPYTPEPATLPGDPAAAAAISEPGDQLVYYLLHYGSES